MIKFRAWDNLLNKMLVVYRISFDGPADGVQVHCYLDDRGTEGSTEYAYDGDGLILEQFTGLKDVNGKEIYEGDIVSVFNEDGNYYNDVIEWGIEYNYPAFDLKYHSHLYESNALSEIMNAGVESIKVIGNVHTDSELLEADK
ncbi:YopX family protein [Lactiplantibacillus plantarum]|uniref:YopX family protein n=1 Tax=Lactiplantibacillus plantarum TaxID=1590 RepID=UPI001E3E0DA9|nr:YopX family protein [Lactiplantibacillus plantarum]